MLCAVLSLVDINIPNGKHFTVCGDVHGQFVALKICAYDSKLNMYIDNQNYFRRMKPKVHVFHGHARADWLVDAKHAPGGKVDSGHVLYLSCQRYNALSFVDLVIEFDLKVTLLKGLRQEFTSSLQIALVAGILTPQTPQFRTGTIRFIKPFETRTSEINGHETKFLNSVVDMSGCGTSKDLYGSNCKHLTLCLSCGKSMAEKHNKCYECGTPITRLIREYNVRPCSSSDKNYFIGRFVTGRYSRYDTVMTAIAATTADTPVNLNYTAKAAVTGHGDFSFVPWTPNSAHHPFHAARKGGHGLGVRIAYDLAYELGLASLFFVFVMMMRWKRPLEWIRIADLGIAMEAWRASFERTHTPGGGGGGGEWEWSLKL
ncbi:hypothetical protein TEA_001244 [Camellia sinensis var. sinensis]|uniref:Serine/threonine specific protein phosphatases domain-containing protein n=1 Tax=Camellia sinensis var. sinensis TaxID=542762 RepID=A0A4S4F299_CAMSN|nr:hypothetical protein TEA_001244 [Camellia sinensis var. sinensis]